MMIRTLCPIIVCVALAGCVSSGKYKALEKKHQATTEELDARNKKVKTLEEEIAEREAKIKELDAQIVNLEEKIRLKEAEIVSLEESKQGVESELAAVVKDRARLRASAEELEKALSEASKRKAEAEKRVAEFRNLLARFKSLIDAGKLKVKIVAGRMVLELPTDVLFASGRAKLSSDGETAIGEIGQILATIPDRNFQVEGHTDNIPISTSRYPSNWELAAARAVTVVKTLRAAGMRGEVLSAASFGEFRPVASNDAAEGRAANRRIEIVIVPDLSSLPGFDELNQAVEG